MALKQISLSIPEQLLEDATEFSEKFAYRNVQELILDLVRNRVYHDRIQRYQMIEEDMDKGKKTKLMSQTQAAEYVNKL